jgi:hypothetical protein
MLGLLRSRKCRAATTAGADGRPEMFLVPVLRIPPMTIQNSIAAWEDEGGWQPPSPESGLTGTANQILWAVQIKRQVDMEFDRVRRALESTRRTRPANETRKVDTMISILEDKRDEVMAQKEAGYFIHDWQELRNQVRQMILAETEGTE